VPGKNVPERLAKVAALMAGHGGKGLSQEFAKPVPLVLVFPTAADPPLLLSGFPRQGGGEILFLEGGYAAAAAVDRQVAPKREVCPSCPGNVSGGGKR